METRETQKTTTLNLLFPLALHFAAVASGVSNYDALEGKAVLGFLSIQGSASVSQ